MNEEFLALVDELSQKDKRRFAAKRIANILGVQDLMFFLLDSEAETFIPAPGMPQILPESMRWQEFLTSCQRYQYLEAKLYWPQATKAKSLVVGMKSKSNFVENEKTCILVFHGKPDSSEKLRHLLNLFPLVATCIRFEWLSIKTKSSLAYQGLMAEKSANLIGQLEQTRQDLQDSLYHSQLALNTRTEFLAIASHELKTPLTCVVLEVSLLKRAILKFQHEGIDERTIRRLDSLETQLRRMTVLIDNLLDYSQVAEGQLTYNHQKTDLIELTKEVVQRFDKQAYALGSKLQFITNGPAYAICDRSKIDQVISNLVSNAIKYGSNKDIVVGVSHSNDRPSIYVEDHGIGIPESEQKKIFDRFERSTSARKYSGFGLGLFVVKKIIDAHQGTIEVQSNPNYGSRFTISLPNHFSHQELV
jgi:signal transduction histidine kinase